MGQPLTFFSDYSGENAVTNYCGLILKILYEQSPAALEEFFASTLPADAGLSVGPKFEQQTKALVSIPDLAIAQRSFSIFFETKLSNWFYTGQIEDHIKGLPPSEAKILYLLSNFEADDYSEAFASAIAKARTNNIIIQPLSFEDFFAALESASPGPSFARLLDQFGEYLDRNGLLPSWKYLLDVVNCGGTLQEIQNGAYMCPDTSGSYSHRRARFFGPYAAKAVSSIHELRGLVCVAENQSSGQVIWNNSSAAPAQLIADALAQIKMYPYRVQENQYTRLQVFLLGNRAPTNFIKDSKGGMFQSKKYFRDIARECPDASSLANKLEGKPWSQFP